MSRRKTPENRNRSQFQEVWKRLRKNRLAIMGLVILLSYIHYLKRAIAWRLEHNDM